MKKHTHFFLRRSQYRFYVYCLCTKHSQKKTTFKQNHYKCEQYSSKPENPYYSIRAKLNVSNAEWKKFYRIRWRYAKCGHQDLLQENIGTLMRKERIIVPWNKFRSGAKFSVIAGCQFEQDNKNSVVYKMIIH
jgi:hypothetical protein